MPLGLCGVRDRPFARDSVGAHGCYVEENFREIPQENSAGVRKAFSRPMRGAARNRHGHGFARQSCYPVGHRGEHIRTALSHRNLGRIARPGNRGRGGRLPAARSHHRRGDSGRAGPAPAWSKPHHTRRDEADAVAILSGVHEGVTLGSPIALLVRNADARSGDYQEMRQAFRPSHADYTYQAKYGVRASAGGGRPAHAKPSVGSLAAPSHASCWRRRPRSRSWPM